MKAVARVVAICIGLVGGWTSAATQATAACPDTPHRLETFLLPAPSLGWAKRILVYLPPGYGCEATRRYPAFFFNDGHDLFDWNPFASELDPAIAADIARRKAWYGSWRLEEQLGRAMADGSLPPLVVVGIASDDGFRGRDLTPVPWDGSAEGRGIEYGEFVARAVVPTVDRRYRTIAQRRCRGIGGASLGGVSALQIGLGHADSFGLVLAISPLLGDPAIAAYLTAAWPAAGQVGWSHFLLDFDANALGSADRAWFALLSAAAPDLDRHLTLLQSPGGHHAIDSWADRVIPDLRQLLARHCPAR
jgi:enterochelin esterase-like enzyme